MMFFLSYLTFVCLSPNVFNGFEVPFRAVPPFARLPFLVAGKNSRQRFWPRVKCALSAIGRADPGTKAGRIETNCCFKKIGERFDGGPVAARVHELKGTEDVGCDAGEGVGNDRVLSESSANSRACRHASKRGSAIPCTASDRVKKYAWRLSVNEWLAPVV